jgi:hypothetical protein
MLKITLLFTTLGLTACSENKGDDSARLDTGTETTAIVFEMTFLDGMSNAPLVGAQTCIEQPIIEGENCFVTDDDGSVEWTWGTPEKTDFLGRLSLDGYKTTLYTGRYDNDVAEIWEEEIAETGKKGLTYFAFTDVAIDLFLNTGETVQQEGQGQALIFMGTDGNSGYAGATATFKDDAGSDVGTIQYVNPLMTGLDVTLEATSASGGISIANAAPGTHTLTTDSESHTCMEGFSWGSDNAGSIQVPIEANVMTIAQMICVMNDD